MGVLTGFNQHTCPEEFLFIHPLGLGISLVPCDHVFLDATHNLYVAVVVSFIELHLRFPQRGRTGRRWGHAGNRFLPPTLRALRTGYWLLPAKAGQVHEGPVRYALVGRVFLHGGKRYCRDIRSYWVNQSKVIEQILGRLVVNQLRGGVS